MHGLVLRNTQVKLMSEESVPAQARSSVTVSLKHSYSERRVFDAMWYKNALLNDQLEIS